MGDAIIPAGSKLATVDGKNVEHLPFMDARAEALSASKQSVLVFL